MIDDVQLNISFCILHVLPFAKFPVAEFKMSETFNVYNFENAILLFINFMVKIMY